MKGYIAVISALILSALLTALVLASSTSVFLARFSERDVEDKERSRTLASSCAYEALYSFAENPNLAVSGETISITPTTQCTIDSLSDQGGYAALYVHAFFNDAYTALKVTGPSSQLSWVELASIPP